MTKREMNVAAEVDEIIKNLIKYESYAYASGYLNTVVIELLYMLPRTKREKFIREFREQIESKVKVKVKSLMTGEEVEIRLSDLGTATDPSQERYWTA